MIVNDKENNIKVIYIKIPKTGGTTISSNIWKNYNQERTNNFNLKHRQKIRKELSESGSKHSPQDVNRKINDINKIVINLNNTESYKKIDKINPYVNNNKLGWHVPYYQIKDYLNKIDESIEDFSKFSIIREPVSRFVSGFRWLKQKQKSYKKLYKSIDYYFDCVYNKDNILNLEDDIFSEKQTYWLNDENGLVPEDMKLFTIDKMNEPETIDYLSDITKFKFNTENRKNISKKKSEIIISSELRSRIENFYSEDCELYEKINKSI